MVNGLYCIMSCKVCQTTLCYSRAWPAHGINQGRLTTSQQKTFTQELEKKNLPNPSRNHYFLLKCHWKRSFSLSCVGLCASWKAAMPDAAAGALQDFPLLILMLIKKEPGILWTALFVKSISGSVFALMTKNSIHCHGLLFSFFFCCFVYCWNILKYFYCRFCVQFRA